MNSWKSIIIRYALLLLFGLGNLFIFYVVFTPLTVYPVFGLISYFYEATLLDGGVSESCDVAANMFPFLKGLACMKTTILFNGYFASIIPACVAGSAYYLLLILNLSTPLKTGQRVKSLFFLLGIFLTINILRIFSFALIYANEGFEFFNIAHATTWYFGSTVLVIILWFTNILVFKIKEIPVYSDFKLILSQVRGQK